MTNKTLLLLAALAIAAILSCSGNSPRITKKKKNTPIAFIWIGIYAWKVLSPLAAMTGR